MSTGVTAGRVAVADDAFAEVAYTLNGDPVVLQSRQADMTHRVAEVRVWVMVRGDSLEPARFHHSMIDPMPGGTG